MPGRFITISSVFLLALGACGPSETTNNNNVNTNTNTNNGCFGDADGDLICDEFEGADQQLDTDGDGTPDFQDLDSDGDGIADSVEFGGGEAGDYPWDSDMDGTPDFQDLDSDDNGLSDDVDGTADIDGDGMGNFADMDDDNDGIQDRVEMGGDPFSPPDSDSDGIPNYQDQDSDNDTILDLHEGGGGLTDTDEDTIPDYLDLDSDNDGVLDSVEAGDTDLMTAPVDSDLDLVPDYRDADSDNDGLPDGQEDLNGDGVVDPGESDPHNEDSDGDGVTDLIEVAAGTDPQDGGSNPQAMGNFVFMVPFEEPTDPLEDTLEFRTSVQFADLYFLMDRTGSMSEEKTALAATTGIPQIITDLTCENFGTACSLDSDCSTDQVCFNQQCIQDPLSGTGCVADLWTGFGFFEDCNEYVHQVSPQANPATTAAAVNAMTFSGGSEAVVQSAACVADPSYCTNSMNCETDPLKVGCAGFRSEAVRILIHITDEGNQAGTSCGDTSPGGASSTASVPGNALAALNIKYIGLYGTASTSGTPCSSAQDCLTQIGTASGTLDTSSQPFVYAALNSAVVNATKQGVIELVQGVPLNVTIGAEDLPGDDGDALQFIDYLEVNVSGTGNCTNVSPTADTDTPADGHDDSFPALLGGTPVCWDVIPVPTNDFVVATEQPQVFKARLTVYGDGSPLDSRDVYFLIPPVIEGPIGPQ